MDDLDNFENVERCIICGDVIPEGRQVCPRCMGEKEENQRFRVDFQKRLDKCLQNTKYSGMVRTKKSYIVSKAEKVSRTDK